jgi:FKBP-type peptidyl-prolyl cis-trans isomerase 2
MPPKGTADRTVRRFISAIPPRVALLSAALALVAGCGREARSGDVVSVHFTGKTGEGQVFETTSGGEPRQVHIGANLILPTFEQALVGMRAGQKKIFTVTPGQAYGPRIEDGTMIQVNYKSNQAHALDYQVGQKLVANIEYPDGSKAQREVTIIGVDEKTFTVDANHPLAGKTLTFEIEMMGIQ